MSKSVNLSFRQVVDKINNSMLSGVIKKIKILPSYFYRNYAAPIFYSLRDRNMLLNNLEIKNKYAGQRCFLIGAGPSIASMDLSKLSQEYTFVVNEFETNKQYCSLMPKFHIISDSDYFNESGPEYWRIRFKEKSRAISTNTTMIVNLAARPFILKYGLFKQHKIYFIGTQGIFTNNLPFNIDFDRYVPNPKNSILMCMMAAVWMGFDKIYLLGCEHSFLAQPLGKSKSLGFSHSYEDERTTLNNTDNDILKNYLSPKLLSSNYEVNMANTLQVFRNYRLFYAKALKTHPNLKIFNATPNSFLDVFPMINFEDIKKL